MNAQATVSPKIQIRLRSPPLPTSPSIHQTMSSAQKVLLLVGPPGSGKSTFAKALTKVFPVRQLLVQHFKPQQPITS